MKLGLLPKTILHHEEFAIPDSVKRKLLCQRMLQTLPPNAVLLSSGEAQFYLNGKVDKPRFPFEAVENSNPQERLQDIPKVTVWCAISDMGVIGPYFFEDDLAVTPKSYQTMLEIFLRPSLKDIGRSLGVTDIWFQQDDAVAHTSPQTLHKLRQMMLPGRLISPMGDVEWPERSPDLSVCDYFLWNYLRKKVFQRRPTNIEELKEIIEDEVISIPVEMCRKASSHFRKRLQKCVEADGEKLGEIDLRLDL